MNELLSWILNTVESVDPVTRTLISGLGMLLETSLLIGLVVPGDTIVLISSTGVTSPAQWVALVLVVIAGAVAGESIGFWLGTFFGPKIRHSALGRRIGERNWERAEHYLQRRGGIAVFLSRFLPVLHSLVPVTVGMSSMRYRQFIAWTVPACVLWAVAYVTVGSLAAGSYRDMAQSLHFAGYIFVGIIAVFLLVILLVKKGLEKSEARHMHSADAPDEH